MSTTPAPADPAAEPAVDVTIWGTTAEGHAVERHRLTNRSGAWVDVITYGASIVSLGVPDRGRRLGDVVLGCGSLADHEANTAHLGATIGRYGNRIGGAQFELDGVRYPLQANNGPSNLHGAPEGFHRQIWSAESQVTATGAEVRLSLTSPDGQSGFPGRLEAAVVMGWDDDNRLTLDYRAETDRPTVCNLTNHSYFDLSAGAAADVLGHEVWIDADLVTEVDADLVPTGRQRSVDSTPFDFRQPRAIGDRIDDDDQQLRWGSGYDHNFVFRPTAVSAEHAGAIMAEEMPVAARVSDPVSGRVVEVSTTEPGVQFYSGNHLNGSSANGSRRFGPRSGFCLETQHPPDSPNRPEFPSTVLRPGEMYRTSTSYRFGVVADR